MTSIVDMFLNSRIGKVTGELIRSRKRIGGPDLQHFTKDEVPLARHLLLAVTYRCLAACPHCYLLQQDSLLFHSQQVMLKDLFDRVIDSPSVSEVQKVTFCGGEALVHPDLFQWIEKVAKRKKWKIVSITNGLSLQYEEIMKKFLQSNRLDSFNVSLDAIDSLSYCKMKGIRKCDFELICRNIKRLTTHFAGSRTRIKGSFVMKFMDPKEIRRIIKFSEDLGFQKITLRALHVVNSEAPGGLSKGEPDKTAVYSEIMADRTHKVNVDIHLPFDWARQTFYCPSLANYLCIGADGVLAPCCHMPWSKEYGRFEEAIENPINHLKIVDMRQKFIRAESENNAELLPKPCRLCTKRTRGNLVFHVAEKKWQLY